MQFSTALLFMVVALVDAEETEPSLAMTNLTTILPPRDGFLVSSRW
jgi:hypothetical protein